MTPQVYLTRRATFSACHRLHSSSLSNEENKVIYGKCNNFHGHGHNYIVEVSVCGPVQESTGMVVNISDLKLCIDKAVMEPLDHKNLDKDVEWFLTRPSTTENLAIFIWNKLKECLPQSDLLHEVKIMETENNFVSYKGEKCKEPAKNK